MLSFCKSPPRIPELLFAAVLIWLFATGQGWTVLLSDGDTGWHIRNGERIIDTRAVPRLDPFSFDSTAHPWFSWEWLSDVLFATLFRTGGLKAVSIFCGIAIAASISLLFRHVVWRGAGVFIALPIALLVAGASSIHYLARPHVVGLVLFATVAWMIDRDRAGQVRRTWLLPLIFALWTNLHGSFLGGLAMLGLWLLETALVKRQAFRRTIFIFACSVSATFCNPYGWRLHAHAIEYLRSGWIQSVVEEFQSPRFRSEIMLQFEILLLCGVATVPWLLGRKEVYPACAILLWAHESLASVRHVPLYGLAAAPFTACWLQSQWNRWNRGRRRDSPFHAFDSINSAWRPWCVGYTIFPLLLSLAVGTIAVCGSPVSFPANKFPVSLVARNSSHLAATDGSARRIFSSDQWSDYLIFRLYPGVRVYFDGRSDFFGPWRGQAYQNLMGGEPDSPAILKRERVAWALVPKPWPLAELLRRSSEWRVADEDSQGILFQRNFPNPVRTPNQNELASR